MSAHTPDNISDIGTLTLIRFNGEEKFRLNSARIRLWKEPESGQLSLYFDVAARVALCALPDTESLQAWPNAEVIVRIESFSLDALAGRMFSVPAGMPEDSDEWIGRFYYVEHQDLDDNEISVRRRDSNRFLVHWTGSTQDVNYYDGSKPATKVIIEGWFEFADTSQ